MTLQELRFFIALAQEKHFHNASKICFVSQPTLSVAIQKLEKDLGVALFERHKNSIQLTEIGAEMLVRAKRIFTEVDEIKMLSEIQKDQLGSVLKLGAIYTIGPYLLPPLIKALHQVAPGMPIEIHEDFTARLRDKLVLGELDAILISLPFSVPGIVTRVLYNEPFVVLLPKKHPLARHSSISEELLSDQNMLMLGEGHCFRDQIISSCPSCFDLKKPVSGVNWRTVEGGSLETIRHMVATGIGLTILPQSAGRVGSHYEDMLVTRPLKAPGSGRAVALAWRSSFPRVKAIEALLLGLQRSVI